jgi:transketolase
VSELLGMRSGCAVVIGEAVAGSPDLITVGADGNALFSEVLRRCPERYVDVGIAESNLVGVAAGLARSGWRPVVGAMAPFLTRRAYEQVRLDISLPSLPVLLIGVGGGLGYGDLGPTHHAVDDIALMSALPDMEIFCPADAWEARETVRHCLPPIRPAYIRLSARADPQLPGEVGHDADPRGLRILRNGADVLVITAGRCVVEALGAAQDCADDDIAVAVAAVNRLRPFPEQALLEVMPRWPVLVTVTEGLRAGGVGDRVSDLARAHRVRLIQLDVDHRYPPVATHEQLLSFYGIGRSAIRTAILAACRGGSS